MKSEHETLKCLRKIRRALYAAVTMVCFSLALVARAHDPGLSAATLRVEAQSVAAHLTFARGDIESILPLDADHDGRVTPQEFEAARLALEEVAIGALEITLDGERIAPTLPSLQHDDSDAVHFEFTFPHQTESQLLVRSLIVQSLPRGHRQFLSVRDAQNRVLGERMLDANSNSFELRVAATAIPPEHPRSFVQFLWLGVEHIGTGYDHLVFLFGLLIVGGSLRAALKIVTAFTLAHSITLALATFNLIRIPSDIVEPLIAVSIMYVGIENIFRRDLERRWRLTFVFGLIHGCGFASVLRDLGIGAGGGSVVVPLLSFNLGVELGQVAIAALALPLIWKWKSLPSFQPRYVSAASVLITLAGGYWLVTRILPGN